MKKIFLLVGLLSQAKSSSAIANWEPSEGGCIESVLDQVNDDDVVVLVTNHKIKFYPKKYGELLSSGSIQLSERDDPFEKAIIYLKALFGYEISTENLLTMEVDDHCVTTNKEVIAM